MDKNFANFPRVLVLTSTFPRWENDPEPAFVYELSRRLTDKFNITVLAPRSPGAKDLETMAGMRIIRFSYFFRSRENLATHSGGIMGRLRANPFNYLLVPFFLLAQLWALMKLLRQEKFDIIHAHWIIPQGLTAALALALTRRNIPLILTSHGGDLYGLQGRIFERLKVWIINRCQAMTVVSRAMKDKVVDMGVAPEKVKVLPMGVDLKKTFVPDPAFKRSRNELLFVGRLVEKKGVEVLIKAMPQIIASLPETRLTIAGSGPLEKDLQALTAELNLLDHVKFLGMVSQNQLPSLYQISALAVFPFIKSRSGDQEGLGLVIVEAMGCGCPVIAGDIPAVKDVIEHKKTGILAPSDDSQALARAVIIVLAEPDLRFDLAEAARKKALKIFDWDVVAGKYEGVFHEMLKPLST